MALSFLFAKFTACIMTNDIRKEGNLNMNKKKDVMMFANKKQMIRTNLLIEVGICSIVTGIATLIIGGRCFYKTIHAVMGDNSTSDVINGIFEDLHKSSK